MNHDLSVIILTYNEELHLERAMKSVEEIAKEIYVIDSGSTDSTLEIAKRFKAKIFHNDFVSQAKQIEWALDNTCITTEWIMRLDADEIIEPDLAFRLAKSLPTIKKDVSGINIERRHIFMDRWIRFGGRFPLTMLRIWRNGQARVEDRWMDEHMVVLSGKTMVLKGGFSDHNLNNLSFFIAKHNQYATRVAIDVVLKIINPANHNDILNASNSSLKTRAKRLIKEEIYNKLPFGVAPVLYFFYRYFFQLGFLDGRAGLIYHFLQGFWYRFLVDAKVHEILRALGKDESREEKLRKLSVLTGYHFD